LILFFKKSKKGISKLSKRGLNSDTICFFNYSTLLLENGVFSPEMINFINKESDDVLNQ